MKTFTKYKLCCQSCLQRSKMKFINLKNCPPLMQFFIISRVNNQPKFMLIECLIAQ
jgi:hypothetical protein